VAICSADVTRPVQMTKRSEVAAKKREIRTNELPFPARGLNFAGNKPD
jgi:hypothetical protein